MVTKPRTSSGNPLNSLILAKIHMVTKLISYHYYITISLILAKIHMVTKPSDTELKDGECLILAKIHMVTKPL